MRRYAQFLAVWVAAVGGLLRAAEAGWLFGTPERLDPLNSDTFDNMPWRSADGLTLYFDSSRAGGGGLSDIWGASRPSLADPFGPPVNLAALNSPADDGGPSITADGLTLFFHSSRPGGQGNKDLFTASRTALTEPFGPPQNLGPTINGTAHESDPWISPDGLTLLFRSTRAGGAGAGDLWMSTRASASEAFGAAVNLGTNVNSIGDEGRPWLSADGCLLLFHSDRPGGEGLIDLYACRRTDPAEPFGPAASLGTALNTGADDRDPFVSSQGDWLYFSSNRDPGLGGTDLWRVAILGQHWTLTWAEPAGTWGSANWSDGSLSLAPGGGEAMIVTSGHVTVDQPYDGALAAASLAIDGGTVEVGHDGTLAVLGKVDVGPDAVLLVDGVLAAETVDAAADAGAQRAGAMIAGSGTITAETVIIGGLLSPGAPQPSDMFAQSTAWSPSRQVDRGAAADGVPSSEVPEPTSQALLLLAIVLITSACAVRRRRPPQ